MPAVLVVGHGLIGAPLRRRLVASGRQPVCVARGSRDLPGFHALDLTEQAGRSRLGAMLRELCPSRVVLTHGPSDVTWVEQHEKQARAVHCGVADVVAGSGAPTVLVSTDNVFPGTSGRYRPCDQVRPANAYGRVKARAEELLLAGGSALVLRVSLVYGWTGPGQRTTFAERCLKAAFDGAPLLAPTDQVFAPLHVGDVVAAIAALAAVPRPLTGVLHLAGPCELSRYEFARTAYQLVGADAGLVTPCLRRDTQWASRPRYSSLECADLTGIGGLTSWQPAPPHDGLRAMLAELPGGVPSAR